MPNNDGSLTIEGAQILFRNFAGAERPMNDEGKRNFCLLLAENVAAALDQDGWNIKRLRPRDDEEIGTPFVKVTVKFGSRPPRIVLLSSKGRQVLEEDMAMLADWVDVKHVDVTIRPYSWEVRGEKGVSAYLKTIYIIVNEDPLDLKYSDVPEIGANEQLAIEAGADYIDAEEVSELTR